MSYRDDNQALRERIAVLEAKLNPPKPIEVDPALVPEVPVTWRGRLKFWVPMSVVMCLSVWWCYSIVWNEMYAPVTRCWIEPGFHARGTKPQWYNVVGCRDGSSSRTLRAGLTLEGAKVAADNLQCPYKVLRETWGEY